MMKVLEQLLGAVKVLRQLKTIEKIVWLIEELTHTLMSALISFKHLFKVAIFHGCN